MQNKTQFFLPPDTMKRDARHRYSYLSLTFNIGVVKFLCKSRQYLDPCPH